MKKEKTVRTYQRRTKSGKMVTVREHKASYDAAEEARKAAAKKAGAGSELSKKKAIKEENPLGFSEADYKEWYHWDMENDANNEAALRVEKALTKKMGKKAYNKYLEDMSNSYSARGHKKAHQSLLDEYTAQQKKQDAESSKAAKDIARGAKKKDAEAKASKVKEVKSSSTSGTYSVSYRGADGKTHVETFSDKESADDFRRNVAAGGYLPRVMFLLDRKEADKPTSAKPTEKATSTESKGHPKVISRIDKLISSYQRDIEKAQKHIDAGEKWVGVKGDRIPEEGQISWREQKKNYEKAIAKLEKGREYHLSGKENQAWKALGDFVGFNKNHVISKETRTKNEVAKEKKRQKTEEQRIKAVAEAHAKDIARVAMGKESKSKSSTTPKKKAKDSDLVEHYDQFNKKSMGKAVGDSFTFSEGRGKNKLTYDARFVTDGRGRYGYVVRDKEEGPNAKYYVGISDGYERHSQLPAGLRKAAEAQGLKFKNGEFVKKETSMKNRRKITSKGKNVGSKNL